MVGDVLAAPDSLAVRPLDDCREIEAPRLLNVRRLEVGSHIIHSAPRERNRPPKTGLETCQREIASRLGRALNEWTGRGRRAAPRTLRAAPFSRLQVYAQA